MKLNKPQQGGDKKWSSVFVQHHLYERIVAHPILLPIEKYPLEFLLLIVLLWFPGFYVCSDICFLRIEYMIRTLLMLKTSSLLFNVGLSYVCLCLLYFSGKFSKYLHTGIKTCLFAVLVLINVCQMFLFDNFGMEINTFAFQLLNETTRKESSEFISTYVLTPSSIKYVIITISVLIIALVYSNKINIFIRNAMKGRFLKITPVAKIGISVYVIACLCLMTCSFPLFSRNWVDNLHYSKSRGIFRINDSFVFKIHNSFVQFSDEKEELNICAQSQYDINSRITGDSIDNIVIIIGESYNRHHSSLYGYDKETNPFLSKIDNLFVFDDVIASINVTAPSFKNFMSLSSVDDSTAWCKKPLFLSIFKNAGYNVVFNSNQFVYDYNMNCFSASCGFFFHPEIRPMIFSKTNTQTFSYDEELVDSYKKCQNTMEEEHRNLIIHHLYGQHVKPKHRYPESRTYFTFRDYDNRKELSKRNREYVATYDNATRYNDSIVSQIIGMYCEKDAIVIYFADHGDEANDYRLHKGRARNMETLGAPCLHCQLDIPFIIYTSESFMKRHPEIVSRIKESVHRPFMTDDLPHLLFDIAGIETKWYEPTRSLINSRYNDKRKRIIKGISLKGCMDYDEVCNKYGTWSIGF